MTTSPGTQADPPLDWSIHARRPDWPTSAKMFLAEAVNPAGAALWNHWNNEWPGWLAHPVVPLPPTIDEAFHGNSPITSVHTEYGPYIQKIMPAAVYRAYFEDEFPPTVILDWELEQEEPISRSHWEEAVKLIIRQARERQFAQKVIVHVAGLIGELAVSGRIRTYLRPLEGGEAQIMSPFLWETHAQGRLVRIATCSLNLAHPLERDHPPTHYIFVDEEDLRRELQSIPPERKGNPVPALEEATVKRTPEPAIINEIVEWLSGMMERPPEGIHWPYEYWKSPKFRNLAVDHFGERYHEGKFNQAYERAKKRYPYFAQKGRPRENTE